MRTGIRTGHVEVVQAYRFALAPTGVQEQALLSHCGAARFAFNTVLAAVKANLDQRSAERTYGITGGDLTESLGWSCFSLQKEWNRRKSAAAPWWAENSKHTYQSGCAALADALSAWAKSRKGVRAGTSVGFPRFKSKARTTPSCSFSDGVRLDPDRRHVVLPRIGRVRIFGSTRKLARRIEAGTARITGTTISYRRGRWMVSLRVRVQRVLARPAHVKAGAHVVGVDLGVRDLVTVATPDGAEVARIAAPRPLEQAQAGLRRLQRKAARQQGPWDPTTGVRQEPSAGWVKSQAEIRRLHHRVANLREDFLHKTTTALAQQHDVIGAETLNVRAMMRRGGSGKRRLNRGLGDAALGTILRQLSYKTTWYGSTLVQADRHYPSTRTCCGCGAVKTKLLLHQRVYTCDHCGLSIDRDHNAAVNLARIAGATHGASAAAQPPAATTAAAPLPAAA